MKRTFEAVVEADGRIRLLEPVDAPIGGRALVTIFDESAEEAANLSALLAEATLEDWNRPEEDSAWSHLQQDQ